jgi:hypothetical protein
LWFSFDTTALAANPMAPPSPTFRVSLARRLMS